MTSLTRRNPRFAASVLALMGLCNPFPQAGDLSRAAVAEPEPMIEQGVTPRTPAPSATQTLEKEIAKLPPLTAPNRAGKNHWWAVSCKTPRVGAPHTCRRRGQTSGARRRCARSRK